MSTRTDIVARWLEAQRTRDAAVIDALGEKICEDVEMSTPRGSLSGRAAVLERLRNPPAGPAAGMMGQLSFGDPVESGAGVTVVAQLPPGLPLPIKALEIAFSFSDDDRVSQVRISPQS